MSVQSDRIREALSRSGAARPSSARPTVQQPTVQQPTVQQPTVKQPAVKPPAAVESTLPLIGASDAQRVALAETKPAEPMPSKAWIPPPPSQGVPHRNLLIIGAAVIVLAGFLEFFTRHWATSAKQNSPLPVAGAPLQVEVGSQGNGLVDIRWNPRSEPVARAREGRLVIMEGGQAPRTVALGPEELKIGHLSYQPSAERLEFRLEVVDASGAVTQESVLALSPIATSRTTPEPAAAAPPPSTATQVTQQSAPVAEAKAAPPPATQAPAPPPQPVRSALRSFQPPSNRSNTTAQSTIVLDAPAPVPVGAVIAPGAAPSAGLPALVSSLPAPPVPVKETPVPRQITVGGNIQAANLLKKVTPVYPPMALRTHVQGTVRFTAVIGRDGRIQNLQVASGPLTLVQAAADAVKQWVYRPTLLNGQPVEVITQIDVTFTLN